MLNNRKIFIVLLFAVLGLTSPHQSHSSGLFATLETEKSLAVIIEKDGNYNAVIALNSDALPQAKKLNSTTSPLGGMPILIKDNIDVQGMPTTAGSLAMVNNIPKFDAPLITLMKQNGAVILGKTNLSEWANFRSEQSSSGWSATGGQTTNAIDTSRSPCGSSSGSATAVAQGYVKVALGTETNGSIVCPASVNGVVGFKPTHGLVNNEGIVPLALTQDTAGPIADTIENAALALSSMIDPSTDAAVEIIDGLRNVSQGAPLKTARIGVLKSSRGYDKRRDTILDNAIKRLNTAGVTVIDNLDISTPNNFWDESYTILLHEFKRDINHYFKSRQYQDNDNPLKTMSLAKLIEFNREHADQELIHFDQNIFEKSQALNLSEDDYKDTLQRIKKTAREEGLDKLFIEHQLDVIIGITVGPAWKIDTINGDAFFGPSTFSYPAIGGHPHITIPGEAIAGLPIGISFIGKRYQDHRIAKLAYQFQALNLAQYND